MNYNIFRDNPDGDYFDDDTILMYTGTAAVNGLPEASNNIGSAPNFLELDTGTWTSLAAYNSADDLTTLTDTNASFTTNEFAGRIINVNTIQRIEAYIISNTATTITVSGDVATLTSVAASDTYEIKDYHLRYDSNAIDAGIDTGAPTQDLDFDTRTAPIDIGADEFIDTDGDLLSDYEEDNIYGINKTLVDTDDDGLSDFYEIENGLDPKVSNGGEDTDGDGVTNDDENTAGSDATRYEIWVNFRRTGSETGTLFEPFNTMDEALAAVPSGGAIRIKGNSATPDTSWTGTISSNIGIFADNGTVQIGIPPEAP